MSTLQTLYKPADLLAMPDANNIELVNGILVEKPVSVLSSIVETRLVSRVNSFCEAHKTGVVMTSTNGIQCFPDDPDKVRKPDLSYVRMERFSPAHLREGYLSIAPDLAAEVISAHDEVAVLNEKVEEYLAAGVLLVWVIDPINEIVHVHRADGTITKLRKHDDLTGENVLPSFSCRIADLFPTA